MDKSEFIERLNEDLGTDFLGGTPTVPDVAEALRPLLTQTQDHVIDLREALGK
jgi:hypothetical protein